MRTALALILAAGAAIPAHAGDVAASDPVDVAVTIYRNPGRNGGALALDRLGGFAVVTETRRVVLPAGDSRLRFEGVVDGIVPESAIVTGLPGGVVEKNRDAALLSPATLLRASLGGTLQLKRTDPVTGKARLVPATIASASEDGVMLQTAEGVEALRCSGLPETFRYERSASGLHARPTLSVLTRSRRAVTAQITLTYIAQGFDWAANYTAHVNPDGRTLDLGGWITLANGNSVSLANARTRIVAGGLNRAYVRQFMAAAPRALAKCWPVQKTSDVPRKAERPYELVQPFLGLDYAAWSAEESLADKRLRKNELVYPMAAMMAGAPPPPPPAPEQLGDLKLYRVAERTTIAARQMKQTRLLDQQGVPFTRIHAYALSARRWSASDETFSATALLRTKNDKVSQLGLPLPAGSFVVEQDQSGLTMLIGQPDLGDTAEGEDVELRLGNAPDVSLSRRALARQAGGAPVPDLPVPLLERWRRGAQVEQVEVSNAGAEPISFELRLITWGSQKVADPDQPLGKEDGQPIWRVTVPANGSARLRYTVADN